jgi:hypothetical protein
MVDPVPLRCLPADEDQRKAAERSAAKIKADIGGKIFTAIEPLAGFTRRKGITRSITSAGTMFS